MKTIRIILGLCFLLSSLVVPIDPVNAESENSPPSYVYRFWNTRQGGHFFTQNTSERDNVLFNMSDEWSFENVAYEVYPSKSSQTKPVFRLWNPSQSKHHYTLSQIEKDELESTDGWLYENIAYYVHDTKINNEEPVYRFWSNKTGKHIFTINKNEYLNILNNLKDEWKFEGIAFYANPVEIDEQKAEDFLDKLEIFSSDFAQDSSAFNAFDTATNPEELLIAIDQSIDIFTDFQNKLYSLPQVLMSDIVIDTYIDFTDEMILLMENLRVLTKNAEMITDVDAEIVKVRNKLNNVSNTYSKKFDLTITAFEKANHLFVEETIEISDDFYDLYSHPAIQDLVNRYISGEITEEEYFEQFMDLYLSGEIDFDL